MDQDDRYLDLLGTFHFVAGGVTALFALFPVIHLTVGLAMLFGGFASHDGPPAALFGLIFVIAGSALIAIGLVMSVLMFLAGARLKRRTHWNFCLVVAAVECIFMPIGTALGILTIILLTKDNVKTRFDADPGSGGGANGPYDQGGFAGGSNPGRF